MEMKKKKGKMYDFLLVLDMHKEQRTKDDDFHFAVEKHVTTKKSKRKKALNISQSKKKLWIFVFIKKT